MSDTTIFLIGLFNFLLCIAFVFLTLRETRKF